MRFFILVLALIAFAACSSEVPQSPETNPAPVEAGERPQYALALHGGAGVIRRERMSEAYEAEVREVLAKALDLGEAALKSGRPAEEAVMAVISYLEDQPQFNAGKGAVFTYEGTNELDASIMLGKDLLAGAVSSVTNVRHPIQLAHKVMTASDHVMLSGAGAEEFAREQGLEIVEPSYFRTENRYKSWQRARERADSVAAAREEKFGTVGCVALDQEGNLAAGTSTGGMTLKRYGRIGDSPVIGAGTYADNRSCAVSATGHGEYFIRYAVAHDISARMLYGGQTLQQAADALIMEELPAAGGTGGVICLDREGNIHMPFNTPGMYRASLLPNQRTIAIFGDE